jgi:anti-sigma regulatory factor (Ser/Thr protein kinase)
MKKTEIRAVSKNLDTAIAFIDKTLKNADCHMKIQNQIELAAEEIFINIASYAYAHDTGFVAISIDITEDKTVRIVFEDNGKPFDPLSRPDPDITLSADERNIGGLGIFMVKKTMDNIYYEYRGGKNILTIEKGLGV